MQNTLDPLIDEGAAGENIDNFLVRNPMEITRIFRSLIQRRELVSAFFNSGNDLLLSAIVDINTEQKTVTLDYGSNEVLNEKLLGADKVIFVTALDRVKVQFVSRSIRKTQFEGRPAFQIALPDQVLRLQRRNFYRIATPIINPLKCLIPMGENQAAAEAIIFDISAGGIGLLLHPATPADTEIGSQHTGCQIELPNIGPLDVSIRVQNRMEVSLKNGSRALRCGCQFIGLKPALEGAIQRYIVKLERERIASTPDSAR